MATKKPAKTSKHIVWERDHVAIDAEYMQTPHWAIEAILRREIMTRDVIDPCCGDGRMAEAAENAGYRVFAMDKHDWGYKRGKIGDFLTFVPGPTGFRNKTVFMNPPFSLACAFVDRALAAGARKIICFQRQVWRECRERKAWWEAHPYNRRYVCGDRATCWYGTIPEEDRKGGAYQPHCWYVWESGNPAGSLEGAIWKGE